MPVKISCENLPETIEDKFSSHEQRQNRVLSKSKRSAECTTKYIPIDSGSQTSYSPQSTLLSDGGVAANGQSAPVSPAVLHSQHNGLQNDWKDGYNFNPLQVGYANTLVTPTPFVADSYTASSLGFHAPQDPSHQPERLWSLGPPANDIDEHNFGMMLQVDERIVITQKENLHMQ